MRVDTQLTNDPLLPMEKFVVGGVDTVRGYRENQLVRDNGLVASLELRIPVLEQHTGSANLRMAPFADLGSSWDDGEESMREEVASAGLGFLYDYRKLHARLYWAHGFDEFNSPGIEDDLQDDGIHFLVQYDYF